jgi:MoaA/NifB/PqqE/SkfB family radical SAM enzyme
MAFLDIETINFYFNKYGYERKIISLILTERCNIQCSHCMMNSKNKLQKSMSKKLISKIFEQTKEGIFIEIFGGEPFLELNSLLYVIQLCKEKNLPIAIFTNGTWGFDQKILKKLNEIRYPINILLTLDNFHKIDIKKPLKIIETFKNNEFINLVGADLLGHHHRNRSDFENLGLNFVTMKLNAIGRSTECSPRTQDILFCNARGLEIYPNGDIYASCCSCKTCLLGNVKTDRLQDLGFEYLSRQPKFRCRDAQSVYELCKGEILKPKWDDLSYIENLDICY